MQEDIHKEESNEISEELFEHHKVLADKGQDPVRIDKFLMDRIPNTSRNKLQIAAKSGNLLVNNVSVKSNYKVRPLDSISLVMPYPVRNIELIPEDIPLDIVYEDDDLIVINKKAGMVVHPGYGNYTGTLVNALVYHFDNLPSLPGNYYGRPGLVHRLDKNTSGIMVVAKTEESLTHLAKQFFDRTTQRRYNALVWGDFEEESGTVTGNLARSLSNRKIMAVYEDPEIGKHAVTHYKVLEKFGYVTLIECKLETGRTHQIRIHMKHIGHTLFNDEEYGGNRILKGTMFNKYKQFVENCFNLLPRQALHAKSLGFTHPKTGEWMQFESDLPPDMEQGIDKWRKYSKL